jgi:hypothetical protein
MEWWGRLLCFLGVHQWSEWDWPPGDYCARCGDWYE